jgi:hypothetical protein
VTDTNPPEAEKADLIEKAAEVISDVTGLNSVTWSVVSDVSDEHALARALHAAGLLADPEQRIETVPDLEREALLDGIIDGYKAEVEQLKAELEDLRQHVRNVGAQRDVEKAENERLAAAVRELATQICAVSDALWKAIRSDSGYMRSFTLADLVEILATERDQWKEQIENGTGAAAERDQLKTCLDAAAETLRAAKRMMATDSRDWSLDRSDVWLYGLIVGWECEERHEHDAVMCGGDSGLRAVAAQHAWAADDIARIRRFRAALQGDQPAEPASPQASTQARSGEACVQAEVAKPDESGRWHGDTFTPFTPGGPA